VAVNSEMCVWSDVRVDCNLGRRSSWVGVVERDVERGWGWVRGVESVVATVIDRLRDDDDAEEDEDEGGRRKLVLVPSSNLPFSIAPSASTTNKSPYYHQSNQSTHLQ
jgi:hypothetical protein